MSARTLVGPWPASALIALVLTLCPPSVHAGCGVLLGTCTGGDTPLLGGRVQLDGTGNICVWQCQDSAENVVQCRDGSADAPCSMAQPVPEKRDDHPLTTGPASRQGVPMTDAYREHSPHILQTAEGETYRVCSHRVDSQADLDALDPFADRFSWGWTPPLTWATWSSRIDNACFQFEAGVSYRPIFLRTEGEFHSYLGWANDRDTAQPPGQREIEAACLFLVESDTTKRARYVSGSPTGEQTNLLGDVWIEETPPGGCPAAGEGWECTPDMAPPLVAGDTIDGLLCGTPSCFSTLASHWGPDVSTVCDATAFTQTNRCDNSTRPATGTDLSATCSTTPPPLCGGTWGPDPATECQGVTFTQTCSADSSVTRTARGTSTTGTCDPNHCPGTWDPAPSTVCDGNPFTQTCSTDAALTRPATGTSTGCPPPPPTCSGTWSPAPSTVCDGDSFTQTCSTDSTLTRPATGTSASACGTPCTERVISGWSAWSPLANTFCSGDSFTQTRTRSCTPGSAGTGTCTVSCSGVSLSDSQPATGTNPGACIITTCTSPTSCGSPPNCYAPNSCGCGGQLDLGCGCGNPAPNSCGCHGQVDLGCGCGNPAPGACGCTGGVDLGCGCGNPAPGACGCNAQVDLGCGCGNPAPGACGCNSQVDLGCGCGNPAPGACGCNTQVDLGCGCGNPGPVCGTCGGTTCAIGGGCPPCPVPCSDPTPCGTYEPLCSAEVCGVCGGSTCGDGTCPDSACGCSSPDVGCGCGNPAPVCGTCGGSTCGDGNCPSADCGCSSPDLGCGCGNPAPETICTQYGHKPGCYPTPADLCLVCVQEGQTC